MEKESTVTEAPQQPVPPQKLPQPNKNLFLILGGIALIGIVLLGAYLLLRSNSASTKNISQISPTITTQISPTKMTNTTISPSTSPTSGTQKSTDWLTYKNAKYGFEIQYPKKYEALNDKQNLYGWPNALVHFYSGGQTYDITIEAWDTTNQYEAIYGKGDSNLFVKKVGNKYITITGADAEMLSTFKITN